MNRIRFITSRLRVLFSSPARAFHYNSIGLLVALGRHIFSEAAVSFGILEV